MTENFLNRSSNNNDSTLNLDSIIREEVSDNEDEDSSFLVKDPKENEKVEKPES